MQIESLKKILDTEDRTTRHEQFKRWCAANLTLVQASMPCIGVKNMPVSQRSEIVEGLAHELARYMVNDNYITITPKEREFVATVTFLKRLV